MSMTLREESVAALLEGKVVEVSVGEPWDFESADGPNRLRGRILSAHVGPEADQGVLLSVTSFEPAGGGTVNRLTATARYRDDLDSFVRLLADGEKVPATLDYGGQLEPGEVPQGSHPFLIGSVRLA